jgi:hypothetical protein
MRVTIQHNRHYDWEPVPSDVILTKAEIESEKIRPAADGGYLMKVTKTMNSYTEIFIPEPALFHTLFHNDVRSLHLTRKQAVALHLNKYILPNHTHQSWMTDISVHDSGPDERVFKGLLDDHVKAGTIDDTEAAAHLAAYMEAPEAESHSDSIRQHLMAHFKIKTQVKSDTSAKKGVA